MRARVWPRSDTTAERRVRTRCLRQVLRSTTATTTADSRRTSAAQRASRLPARPTSAPTNANPTTTSCSTTDTKATGDAASLHRITQHDPDPDRHSHPGVVAERGEARVAVALAHDPLLPGEQQRSDAQAGEIHPMQMSALRYQ